MTTKEEILQIVELLDDDLAAEALGFLRSLLPKADPHVTQGVDQGHSSEFWKLGQPTSADDPLWDLVGIIGDEYDVPSDLSVNHDKYLAESYADLHDK